MRIVFENLLILPFFHRFRRKILGVPTAFGSIVDKLLEILTLLEKRNSGIFTLLTISLMKALFVSLKKKTFS